MASNEPSWSPSAPNAAWMTVASTPASVRRATAQASSEASIAVTSWPARASSSATVP